MSLSVASFLSVHFKSMVCFGALKTYPVRNTSREKCYARDFTIVFRVFYDNNDWYNLSFLDPRIKKFSLF